MKIQIDRNIVPAKVRVHLPSGRVKWNKTEGWGGKNVFELSCCSEQRLNASLSPTLIKHIKHKTFFFLLKTNSLI